MVRFFMTLAVALFSFYLGVELGHEAGHNHQEESISKEINYVIRDITLITKDGIELQYQIVVPESVANDAYEAAITEAADWYSTDILDNISSFHTSVRWRYLFPTQSSEEMWDLRLKPNEL